jgi:hypothetical protein
VVGAATLVEVAVRVDVVGDVMVGVVGADVAAHDAAATGERHGVMGARGRV